VKARKTLRAAEFELRARNMGITEEALVAQKVAIGRGCGLPNRTVKMLKLVSLFRSILEVAVRMLLIKWKLKHDAWALLNFFTSP